MSDDEKQLQETVSPSELSDDGQGVGLTAEGNPAPIAAASDSTSATENADFAEENGSEMPENTDVSDDVSARYEHQAAAADGVAALEAPSGHGPGDDMDAEEPVDDEEEAMGRSNTTEIEVQAASRAEELAMEADIARHLVPEMREDYRQVLEALDNPIDDVPYLADEFVLWLWYRSERDFTTFTLTSNETVDLWVDDRMSFKAVDEEQVVSTFKGGAPATLPEAKLSILSGKRIVDARIGMRRGEAEWNFALKIKGGQLHIDGLKIPGVVKDGVEEMVYERMYLVDAVTEVLSDLFGQFFLLRTSEEWEGPSIREWLLGEEI